MVEGKIVQCIGAVVDVEFPREGIPKVYDALKMDNSELTLEVQQQLGDGIVRTIASHPESCCKSAIYVHGRHGPQLRYTTATYESIGTLQRTGQPAPQLALSFSNPAHADKRTYNRPATSEVAMVFVADEGARPPRRVPR